MKYIVDKSQYDKVVIKLLYSIVGKITFEKTDFDTVAVWDKNMNRVATIWINSKYASKGCKSELDFEKSDEISKYLPVVKKKRFSKLLALFFEKNTGIKIDCVQYFTNYRWVKSDYEGDEGDYERDTINYSLKKKKFIKGYQ